MMKEFFECCERWARSISPRGKIWFWLLFLPVTVPFVSMAGDRAYEVVFRLCAVGIATLTAIWVSYLIRSYFDEDLELLLLRSMVNQVGDRKELEAKTAVILSRALMIAASWLARAIVMVGFLWAVIIAFGGSYVK